MNPNDLKQILDALTYAGLQCRRPMEADAWDRVGRS